MCHKGCCRACAQIAKLDILVDVQNALPDILCVAQVALEGAISKQAALASLSHGTLPQVGLNASGPSSHLSGNTATNATTFLRFVLPYDTCVQCNASSVTHACGWSLTGLLHVFLDLAGSIFTSHCS